jgi:hypothetical protein
MRLLTVLNRPPKFSAFVATANRGVDGLAACRT